MPDFEDITIGSWQQLSLMTVIRCPTTERASWWDASLTSWPVTLSDT